MVRHSPAHYTQMEDFLADCGGLWRTLEDSYVVKDPPDNSGLRLTVVNWSSLPSNLERESVGAEFCWNVSNSSGIWQSEVETAIFYPRK